MIPEALIFDKGISILSNTTSPTPTVCTLDSVLNMVVEPSVTSTSLYVNPLVHANVSEVDTVLLNVSLTPIETFFIKSVNVVSVWSFVDSRTSPPAPAWFLL